MKGKINLKISREKLILGGIYFLLICFFIFTFNYKKSALFFPDNLEQENDIRAEEENRNVSPISGLPCENYNRRPIAVMIANDNVARPLSGLSSADMIFEMQVVEDSVTRLMAVYVCEAPEEIGSIRSARDDFIPLAMGIDAIYAHWGGSHFALDLLNSGIMDNIDAMKNPYEAFFRKNTIYAPHNGFSSISRLTNSATKLGYGLENTFEGYPHLTEQESINKNQANNSLKISYSFPYNVEYQYDAQKNSYLRFRGGKAEIDKNTGQQVEVKNVVILRAKSRPLEGQYNDVEIEGTGDLTVYQNGEAIGGTWSKAKNSNKSKLYFYNEKGEEIKFLPGLIWVEIIEPEKQISWLATDD